LQVKEVLEIVPLRRAYKYGGLSAERFVSLSVEDELTSMAVSLQVKEVREIVPKDELTNMVVSQRGS
jgi:hypothetical protein